MDISRRSARSALAIGLASLAACAADPKLPVATVLNYDRCQGIDTGLTRVDYAAVAGIRGSTLLEMQGDAPAVEPADAPLLIAISRGRQPTPGYRFTLQDAERQGTTAVITVRWDTPEPGSVLPQVTTHPCLVVSLPHQQFERVEAHDQDGTPLGALDL